MMKAQMGRERKTLWRQVDNTTTMRHDEHKQGGTSTWGSRLKQIGFLGQHRAARKAAIHLRRALRAWAFKPLPHR